MSEQGNRPYGRDPEGVIWPDRLVVARSGAVPPPGPHPGPLPGAPSGGPRHGGGTRAKGARGGGRGRLAAVAGAGAVTFAGTLLAMNVMFGGSESEPPRTQALQECETPECLAPSQLPTGSPSAQPTQSKSPKPVKSAGPGASATPTTTPSTVDARAAATERPSRDRSEPREGVTRPGRAPVAVSFQGSDNGWREYRGTYTVTNRGGDTLRSWRLTFELSRARLRTLWPLPYRQDGDTVVVEGGPLSPGASSSITFLAEGGGSTRTADCTINGSPCASR
ncbi:cellulose binding domain-containing protein [Spirillospora sp. NPDC047279]|uniref:cellulose binding domain-containing protein n=1 Tax=Spirillospora sp. NPDC047279 TaxID=3155478 RepID=UPI0033ED69E2